MMDEGGFMIDAMRTGPSREFVLPLQALFDALSDGLLVTNDAGERTYSNAALDALVGGDARMPLHSAEPPAFLPSELHERYRGHRAAARRGDTLSLEWSIRSSSGQLVPVAVKTLPVQRNGAPSPVAYLWLFVPLAGTADARVQALERALQRIAHEVDRVKTGAPEPPQAARLPAELSARESEVVGMLLEGHRVAGVAEVLCVSPHTVRNHLKSVFRKLGVHSQAELIRFIREQS